MLAPQHLAQSTCINPVQRIHNQPPHTFNSLKIYGKITTQAFQNTAKLINALTGIAPTLTKLDCVLPLLFPVSPIVYSHMP